MRCVQYMTPNGLEIVQFVDGALVVFPEEKDVILPPPPKTQIPDQPTLKPEPMILRVNVGSVNSKEST